MTFTDEERAELITALAHTIAVAEGLLDVSGRLADALEAERRPSPQELLDLRGHIALARGT